MNSPIETYRRLKTDLEQMLERANDFKSIIDEIEKDPFVAKPSDTITGALGLVLEAQIRVMQALDTLRTLAPTIDGAEPDGSRASVGTYVDDGVRDEPLREAAPCLQ